MQLIIIAGGCGRSYERRLGFDNFDDFTAFVLATVRAGAVSPDLLLTIRALSELGNR
jgi:hypothetical protein